MKRKILENIQSFIFACIEDGNARSTLCQSHSKRGYQLTSCAPYPINRDFDQPVITTGPSKYCRIMQTTDNDETQPSVVKNNYSRTTS